jgi:hypothetical protein
MDNVLYCTRPAPHVCAVNGPCNGWPVMAGIPIRVLPHLPPHTIFLFNEGTPRVYIETDSPSTVLAAIKEANLRRADFEAAIVREYGKRFWQAWGIVERAPRGDGYLDLYTQHRWEGWKLAQAGQPDAGRAATISFNKFLESRTVSRP